MESVNQERGFVSVVMAVYNAELFLKEAIDSVINQSFKNFEFIIINDGSTDSSSLIIKSYNDPRIVLIEQTNQGLSKSLNRGISISKSEYIVRMDADDIAYPSRLQKQVDFMQQNPFCVLCGSNVDFLDVNGGFLYKSDFATANIKIKQKLPYVDIMHSTAIFKKLAFYQAQQYPEEIFHHFEDKILFNRIAEYGEFHNLPEVLLGYRLVPTSISNLDNTKIQKLNQISDGIISNNYTITKEDVNQINAITEITKKNKLANYHLGIGSIHLKKNNKVTAAKNFIASLYYSPFNLQTYLKLIACSLPHSFVMRMGKLV